MNTRIPLVQDLLPCSTALTVNALPGAGAAFEANGLAAAVGLDMADWWEPTAASHMNHVPKSQIVQALKEVCPGLADGGVEAMKKEALVACAAARRGQAVAASAAAQAASVTRARAD